MLRAGLFALFLGVSVAPAWAAPSFDCAKAVTAAEKTICARDDLAALDVELAATYKVALAKGVVAQDGQRQWLKERDDACYSDHRTIYVLKDDCMGSLIRERIEELRQRILTGQIATNTVPQFGVFNIPDAWWGFTPVYPEGVKNPRFESVHLSEGKIVAKIVWDAPSERDGLHHRWIDVVTGEIAADSMSTPARAERMEQGLDAAEIRPPGQERVWFEDGTRIQQEYADRMCGWPLEATISLYDKSHNIRSSFKILQKLGADHAFDLRPDYCDRRFGGLPKHVTAHFQTRSLLILSGAPDGTWVGRAGDHLVRFRNDLSSPYFQRTSDLAVVQASDVAAAESAGTDAVPESRFAGLEALFSKARAEAKP